MMVESLYLNRLVVHSSGQLFKLQVFLMLVDLVLNDLRVLRIQSLVQVMCGCLCYQRRDTEKLIEKTADDWRLMVLLR